MSLTSTDRSEDSSPTMVQQQRCRMDDSETTGPTAVLATIGYEGRSIDEFIALLLDAEIEILVDVRETPLSRKPGFSKRRLAEALDAVGIEYRHERLLGNPKDNRDAFRAGAPEARSRFLAHLNNGSRTSYDEVIALTSAHRLALLCFERAHDQCHRSCIAEQAAAENSGLQISAL